MIPINSNVADILFKRLFILLCLLIVAIIVIYFFHSTATPYPTNLETGENLLEINKANVVFTSFDL